MRKSRIALVGHEPELGELAAKLIAARQPIEFKKGAICRIDFSKFCRRRALWSASLVSPPRVLRQLPRKTAAIHV